MQGEHQIQRVSLRHDGRQWTILVRAWTAITYTYLYIRVGIFFYVLTFWKLQKGIMLLRDTAGPRIYSYYGLCAITSTTPRKEKRALSLYYNVNVYQFNLLEWQ